MRSPVYYSLIQRPGVENIHRFADLIVLRQSIRPTRTIRAFAGAGTSAAIAIIFIVAFEQALDNDFPAHNLRKVVLDNAAFDRVILKLVVVELVVEGKHDLAAFVGGWPGLFEQGRNYFVLGINAFDNLRPGLLHQVESYFYQFAII